MQLRTVSLVKTYDQPLLQTYLSHFWTITLPLDIGLLRIKHTIITMCDFSHQLYQTFLGQFITLGAYVGDMSATQSNVDNSASTHHLSWPMQFQDVSAFFVGKCRHTNFLPEV